MKKNYKNKMNYQEKQQYKLERFQELAEKHKAEAKSVREYGDSIADMIPLGQPILVGHHSEKRHRKDIERIQNSMNKHIEHLETAEHYEKKAENILNPNSISSDNPEAINLLKERLKGLETKREHYKEYNKKARKENKEQLPSYTLSNLSQNINSVKQRIEHLEQIQKIPDDEKTINGITIKTDKEENRIKMFFPSIPSEEIRTKLKRNGFKWSGLNRCWQRQLNNTSIYLADEIARGLNG